VSLYHFAIPNASSGAAQAQFAVEYSGYATGPRMLPLMLDIEYDPYVSTDHTNECYGLSQHAMTAWIWAFVTTARELTGQHPVIYTTADWWQTCTGGAMGFGANPMWVAAYGFSNPPLPAGWRAYTYWQFTSGGTVPGILPAGETDLDAFDPQLIGLIDPGSQASRTRTRIALHVGSLAALAGEKLTWRVTGLPAGLRLSTGGEITGTLTDATTAAPRRPSSVTVTVRNSAGAAQTATFSWRVAAGCTHSEAATTECLDGT
jgi:hypothetical protein